MLGQKEWFPITYLSGPLRVVAANLNKDNGAIKLQREPLAIDNLAALFLKILQNGESSAPWQRSKLMIRSSW